MRTLFRVMTPAGDGQPATGRSARLLGVRVPPDPRPDIQPDQDGTVHAGGGGMSVSPGSMWNLPPHRLPRRLGRGSTGKNGDYVFAIEGAALGTDLSDRPDPARPDQHAFVEPREPMRLERYEAALAATRPRWERVCG